MHPDPFLVSMMFPKIEALQPINLSDIKEGDCVAIGLTHENAVLYFYRTDSVIKDFWDLEEKEVKVLGYKAYPERLIDNQTRMLYSALSQTNLDFARKTGRARDGLQSIWFELSSF